MAIARGKETFVLSQNMYSLYLCTRPHSSGLVRQSHCDALATSTCIFYLYKHLLYGMEQVRHKVLLYVYSADREGANIKCR